MKKTALLLAFVMLLSALFACSAPTEPDDSTPSETTPSETPSVPETGSVSYNSITEKYEELVNCLKNGEELPSRDGEKEFEKAVYDAVFDAVMTNKDKAEEMAYGRKDLNRDGKDELILLSKNLDIYAVFAKKDGITVSLFTPGCDAVIDSRGIFYLHSGTRFNTKIEIKKLIDGELVGDEFGSSSETDSLDDVVYYKTENGERKEITRSEYIQLSDSVSGEFSSSRNTVKCLGIRVVPVIKTISSTAPVADFSSYNAILALYKTCVEEYPKYSLSAYANGDFDDLYTFKSDEAYEIFHSVFYGGAVKRPMKKRFDTEYAENGKCSYGYAQKDLDGDGVQELILMTDRFNVIAVFTQNGGKPVLLDAFDNKRSCFIDGDGRLHVSVYVGGPTMRDYEYMVYELNYPDFDLKFAIGSVHNISLEHSEHYKIEGGKQIPMNADEWYELYDEFTVNETIYSDAEKTRILSGLNFKPLYQFEKVDPEIKTYADPNVIGGRSIEIKSFENGKVVFTYTHSYLFSDDAVMVDTFDGEAVLTNGKYTFDVGEFSGELEFGVNCVWMTVKESSLENIECRPYLLVY